MEQTINTFKGVYVLLFVIAAGIAVMWVAMVGIYTMHGLAGLVITGIVLGSGIFIYCLNTYDRFDLSTLKSQRETIIDLNATYDQLQLTLGKMIVHENKQGDLISQMMKVLSMDNEKDYYDQLSDARCIVARMKARIVNVRKV